MYRWQQLFKSIINETVGIEKCVVFCHFLSKLMTVQHQFHEERKATICL